MSKVLMPQPKAEQHQQQQKQLEEEQNNQQENTTNTTAATATTRQIMMAASTQIKQSKEKRRFTTPKQTHSQKDLTLSSPASSPESPTRIIDFDDFTSTSSIMDFLKQEQKCASGDSGNGQESDIDAESIFQEVSRLADSSDTRSVDELLREAELLLQHHNYADHFNTHKKKKSAKLSKATQSTIQMNAKYTKSIENVKPPITQTKLLNGYYPPIVLKDKQKVAQTPETPTPTNSIGLRNGSNMSFKAFVDNLPSESVISEESIPRDMQGNATTASIKSSSSSNNTTGKDITTKQMDDDDTDEGTDTVSDFFEMFFKAYS